MLFAPKSSAGSSDSIQESLDDLVKTSRESFQSNLKSIILFGSGAENRLRPASDLNLLFVLGQFEQAQADTFREPLRVLSVTRKARIMFLLESEITNAMETFAVKFDDILRRRKVIYGPDVFADLSISRQAKKQRLSQILLNLTLRLREQYAMRSLHEEQLAAVIAESAGPLRSATATLLELEGQKVTSPKEAMEIWVNTAGQPAWVQTLHLISQARESGFLPPGQADQAVFHLMAMAQSMRQRAERLD